ncbi:hypothetical protein [Rhizobium rhizogenes]|uniref:hypothetical protein n=1 Tax=Rhizobium rhizogenes TaxID=359 RepID=UPI0024BE5725|nr:hypothetical protein [Rhizobium rhizogenes]MDJ1632707.1 hypothetical protein [Rhizobium rhizogenes]
MATEADRRTLEAIRTRHDEASREWSLDRRGEEIFACLAPGTQPVAILTTSADCSYQDREFLLHAHADIAFLLRLLAEAFGVIRRMSPQRDRAAERASQEEKNRKPADYAAECAMKCSDRLFRRFLVEEHGVPDVADAERVIVSVRNILRIKSRAELNTDPAAAARWVDFRGAFEAWRTHG